MTPSNYRRWSPDQAEVPTVELDRNLVTVRNVRNCRYLTAENYLAEFEDRTYDLNKVQSVDFIVVPFAGMPALAHTMLSFGFADGEYLAVSVEIRKEKGEQFDIARGLTNGYEIMYVAGDEGTDNLDTYYPGFFGSGPPLSTWMAYMRVAQQGLKDVSFDPPTHRVSTQTPVRTDRR